MSPGCLHSGLVSLLTQQEALCWSMAGEEEANTLVLGVFLVFFYEQ